MNEQLHVSTAVYQRKGSTVPKNKWLSKLRSWPGFDDEEIFASLAVNRYQVSSQESISFSQMHN